MSAVSGNDAGEGETDDLVTRFLPASTQVTFGAASGTAAGYALRQGGKVAGVVLGGGFIFVQSLAYLGYIQVDWRKVERDYYGILDMDGDGKITSKDFQLMLDNTTELLKFNLPAGSGFAGGLAYGLTGSLKIAAGAPLLYSGATSLALGGIPTDIFTTSNLNKGMNNIVDMGNTLVRGGRPVDKRAVLDRALKERTIEELRQIEWEVKHDVSVSADLLNIDMTSQRKEELLDMIETSKVFVKSQ